MGFDLIKHIVNEKNNEIVICFIGVNLHSISLLKLYTM